jgi:hypothetical protein
MGPHRKLNLATAAAALVAALSFAAPAAAQASRFMREAMPGADYVARYAPAERAAAAEHALALPQRPRLGRPVSLTPNAPRAPDGSRLHFWKPSFLIGADNGGEAAVNLWGMHVEGHINVGYTPRTENARLIDCRLQSAGPITYKVFAGAGETFVSTGQIALAEGHFFLVVPVQAADTLISVELWPTLLAEPMGFFGCDISELR